VFALIECLALASLMPSRPRAVLAGGRAPRGLVAMPAPVDIPMPCLRGFLQPNTLVASKVCATPGEKMRTRAVHRFCVLASALVVADCGGGDGVLGALGGGEAPSVTLSWTAPTLDESGASLGEIAGYYVYAGPTPEDWTIGPRATSSTEVTYSPSDAPSVTAGTTLHFWVRAYNSGGALSTPLYLGSKRF
jgi:hypothetical protein